MQIVIEITDRMYEAIKQDHVPIDIGRFIRNGTPLPKGHGRLIDESEIDWLTDNSGKKFTFEERIKNTSPTIIEADKTESEIRGLSMEIDFYHGVFSDSYEKQANEQGYTFGEEAEFVEKIGFGLVAAHIHGAITENEYDKIIQRFQKKILMKYLKEI